MIVPIFLRPSAPVVYAGANLYSRSIGRGRRRRTTIYSSQSSASFQGAFHLVDAAVGQQTLTAAMTAGYVNGVEPVGSDGKVISQTNLELQIPAPRAWLCLKVRVDEATGRMIAGTQEGASSEDLGIDIYDSPRGGGSEGGLVGYAPLVLIDTEAPIARIYQIAYFSYRHSTSKRLDAMGPRGLGWRHFFHVA
jgi:hypothetical protein